MPPLPPAPPPDRPPVRPKARGGGGAEALLRRVRALAALSALAAGLLWALVFSGGVGASQGRTLASAAALGILLAPAAGTALGVWGVRRLLALPGSLAAETRASVRRGRFSGSSRLLGFMGVVWRLRGLAAASRGAALWATRLASLPLVLGLIAAFALNFVVIGAAGAAVLAWALRAAS